MDTKQILFLYILLILLVTARLFLFFLSPFKLNEGQKLNFETTIYAEPKISGNYKLINTQYGNFMHATQITIKVPFDSDLSFADKIAVSGVVKKVDFANKEQIQLVSTKIEKVEPTQLSFLSDIRNHITSVTEKSFSSQYSGLVLGIMLGIKNGLSTRQTQAMQTTGFSHFMVIDGMKITLFASFILIALSYFLKRQLAIILSILIVLSYVALSGFEVSALRAGIMAIFALSAQMFGRQNSGLHILLLTAAALLFLDPLLLQSVAFQLSFAATAGIIVLKPMIKLEGLFMDDISMTVAAQASTLPILLSVFGNYGLMSIPAHALVLWEIPFIMIINGVGALISFAVEPLGSIIMQLSTPLLWYFQNVNYFFGNLNYNLQLESFSVVFSISYYLMLISLVLFIKRREFNRK